VDLREVRAPAAGVIDRVEMDSETIFIRRSKDEIKAAPEFDRERERDGSCRGVYGDYYGSLGSPPVP
jgi:hypothetical protein